MEAIKVIALYLGISISNFFLSIIYLSLSGLPGGEVGMAPFMIGILSLFTLGISTAVYWVIRIWIRKASSVRAAMIYHMVYFSILSYSWIEGGTHNETINEFMFWTFLLAFPVDLVVVITLLRRERQKAIGA